MQHPPKPNSRSTWADEIFGKHTDEISGTGKVAGLENVACPADEGPFGRYQEPDRSISTGKGTVALISPVNTSPSRYRLLAGSSR